MSVVSVRLAPDQEDFLLEHDLKPGPFAKAAVDREIRRLQVQEALQRLSKVRRKVRPGRSSTEMIREDRDHGH